MIHNRRSFLQSVALGTGTLASTLSETTGAVETSQTAKAGAGTTSAQAKSVKLFARAVEVEHAEIYRPAKRPAYAAWVAPWN